MEGRRPHPARRGQQGRRGHLLLFPGRGAVPVRGAGAALDRAGAEGDSQGCARFEALERRWRSRRRREAVEVERRERERERE